MKGGSESSVLETNRSSVSCLSSIKHHFSHISLNTTLVSEQAEFLIKSNIILLKMLNGQSCQTPKLLNKSANLGSNQA